MKLDGANLRLSATDLSNHLGCAHRTNLNRAVAEGWLTLEETHDGSLQVLFQRGLDHEAAFVAHLKEQGLEVVELPSKNLKEADALEQTAEAMKRGAEVITQARLKSGRWFGIADVLRKVPRKSDLGGWSYEAWDTKLARETKAGAVLQLCLYSELLGLTQGVVPEHLHVVSPGRHFQPDTHRVADYLAYYRLVKRRLEAAVDAKLPKKLPLPTYPEPVEGCGVCRWQGHCEQQLRQDDHLSLVANCSRSQRTELGEHEVTTLARLAKTPVPIRWKPRRGSRESLGRTREQARIQYEGREQKRLLHELLPVEPRRGLALLPEPSPGDLFFDFEGDPFVTWGDGSGANGLEYLFGYAYADARGKEKYEALWCLDFETERATFERFVDWLMARWKRHPELHVFHYAPYEPTAMKRLMGRYGTREEEVDQLLRAEVFVDLYAVVRQGLRASVESYSIKRLEPFYGYERGVELVTAGASRRLVEHALELGEAVTLDEGTRLEVEGYNKDDCLSAWRLRDWLEGLRAKQGGIERPPPADGQLTEERQQGREEHRAVREALTAGIPADVARRSEEQRAKLLLSHLVDFYWREGKGAWWELYRLKDLPDEDLLDERAAIAELTFEGEVARTGKSGKELKPAHRYRFPQQEVQEAADAYALDELGELRKVGSVDALDATEGTIDLLQSDELQQLRPRNIFLHGMVRTDTLEQSLFSFAKAAAEKGLTRKHPNRAGVALLLKEKPRLAGQKSGPLLKPGEEVVAGAARVALAMDETVLPIQGPPGTGKSHTGAEVICRLVEAGKRVGITAVSHAVIEGLLEKTLERARALGVKLRVGHKDDVSDEDAPIRKFKDNKRALAALKQGEIQVLGGTSWLWANEAAAGAVHHLIIDEAGQLSLANALAVAPAAQNLILLGDHKQLDQPQKVTHPEGSDISALEHLLGTEAAVAPDQGIFLERTRRLHPSICALTSELYYGGKLHPLEGLERQALVDTRPISGSGLWFFPVEHEGNKNHAPEEVEAVAGLVKELLRKGGGWIDAKNKRHPLTPECIEVVAPYNAQVNALQEAVLPGVRVGTVDKFQGTQAPVVILSMTSSSSVDAPRGMEFLYNPKRFNVATSRAQCACVVVGAPALFEAECRTPEQMKLANAFCRYLELGQRYHPI